EYQRGHCDLPRHCRAKGGREVTALSCRSHHNPIVHSGLSGCALPPCPTCGLLSGRLVCGGYAGGGRCFLPGCCRCRRSRERRMGSETQTTVSQTRTDSATYAAESLSRRPILD